MTIKLFIVGKSYRHVEGCVECPFQWPGIRMVVRCESNTGVDLILVWV